MRRIVLKIEYNGKNFCGFQTQPDKRTVQEEIEKAIEKATGEKVNLVGSGRTDSGVHAEGQIAHFDTNSNIPPEKFAFAINPYLDSDVSVVESFLKYDGFHARFSAKKKTYEYKMYYSPVPHPLKDERFYRLKFPVDVKKMKKACKYFLGKHDFKCFLASNSKVKDTVRVIYKAKVEKRGEDIIFTVQGNGFLYNMVRIMAGTLVKVGEGKIKPKEVKNVIKSGKRQSAGITLAPEGLTLKKVEY